MNGIYRYDARIKEIGARIRTERKRIKKSQEELAADVASIITDDADGKSIGQTTVSNWEKGLTMPPLNKLICLSQIFGCDVGYLLGDYDERTRDHADACSITGLSQNAVDILIALKKSKSIYAPFRRKVINMVLESKIFWEEIIEHIQSAYLTMRGIDGKLEGNDDLALTTAIETVKLANLGGVTRYTVYSGKQSTTLQIQCAANAAQRLFHSIINHEVKKQK